MIGKISRLFLLIPGLLIMITAAGLSASAQTSGEIVGTIQWQKSYGLPYKPANRPGRNDPCSSIVVRAHAGEFRAPGVPVLAGKAKMLGFYETSTNYECRYLISDLPTGKPVTVQVFPASDWDGNGVVTTLKRYKREFKPLGWSGSVTLRRERPDFPASARGDFKMIATAQESPATSISKPRLPIFDKRH